MDFTEHIITYYTIESRHCFVVGMVSGIVLIIAAILFWTLSTPGSMLKGMALVFLAGGLIFGLGGYFAGMSAREELPEKLALYKKNRLQFTEQEVAKVEKIHTAWTGLKIFWSAFILFGLMTLFIVIKPFWIGVALALLLIGTLGHIEEAVSKKHNEKYRNEVLRFKFKNH